MAMNKEFSPKYIVYNKTYPKKVGSLCVREAVLGTDCIITALKKFCNFKYAEIRTTKDNEDILNNGEYKHNEIEISMDILKEILKQCK